LARIYTIDICAYAVMSNHYHLILKINNEKEKLLSEDEESIKGHPDYFFNYYLLN